MCGIPNPAFVLPERRVPLRLNYAKYGGALTEDNLIRLAALLIDYSTRQATLAVRNIVLENPDIQVRVSTPTNYTNCGTSTTAGT